MLLNDNILKFSVVFIYYHHYLIMCLIGGGGTEKDKSYDAWNASFHVSAHRAEF